jgi:hypothetical protein
MQLLMKPLDQIKPNSRNARTHSSKQEAQIAGSIETYGFHNPILLDEQDVIIAGHGRWAAARKLGMTDIPVIVVRGLSEAKKRGLALADNRIALNAGWDLDILAIELKELSQLDLDFDLEVMGFETAEIDVLIDGQQPCAIDQRENQLPSIPATAVTRLGDLWLLGPHRLLCADAREPASYSKLMAGDRVRVMFADPPYNVKIDGHVCGTGRIRHREFSMAAGEMSEQQFTDFLTIVTKNSADVSVDGAIHFICMDWRHMNELLTAGKATTPNSRISASGAKTMADWVHSTAPNMSWCSYSRSERRDTLIQSSWDAADAIAPTFGATPASIPCGPVGLTISPCIRPSNQRPSLVMRSKIAADAVKSCWTHSLVPEPR